jgi:thioredoxin reductase (NADPH)
MESLVIPEEAFPTLSASQVGRLRGIGRAREVAAGDILSTAGDRQRDFVFIESGEVELVREAMPDHPEVVVLRIKPGTFLGELNMITGQAAYLTARVSIPGQVRRLSPEGFRKFMLEDAELSEIILKAFIARRSMLQSSEGARSIELLGSRSSREAFALRNWAARQQLAHMWIDVETPEGESLRATLGLGSHELPIAITPTSVLRNATPNTLASELGLSFEPAPGREFDLVVVGGGPAGLAAAVAGASEGLDTVLFDSGLAGGQAAASSRIENYLGFPSGLTGADLATRAIVQAQKFGARIVSTRGVAALCIVDGQLAIRLTDGSQAVARAVMISSGARYRTLPVKRWQEFEGAGIFHAATELEVSACGGPEVVVVGGANSAGQAALFLASRQKKVRLVVRSGDIAAGMSRYLVDRVLADPQIEVHSETEVVELAGTETLEAVTLRNGTTGNRKQTPCNGLFCFIGAVPGSDWVEGVALDDDGFVLTDHDIPEKNLSAYAMLGRLPFSFETSVPGVFAAGDVRHGSMKRVASAVGEGASAIRSVHQAIGNG